MAIRILPYTEADVPAVADFNRRLKEGGMPADYVFSESAISAWLPPAPNAPVHNEFYLAREGDSVRGAYALKFQQFILQGAECPVAYYHHPFSEGLVDKQYAQVGLQMLLHVVRSQKLLYMLGMGGYDRPLPRMLMALKWSHCLIPFFFRVEHPARFLRQMQAVRRSAARRALADVLAFSGAGWAALRTAQGIRGVGAPRRPPACRVEDEFDDWADEIWRNCRSDFAMTAIRDARTLRALYPRENQKVVRLRVSEAGRLIGWAVVAEATRPGHEQYGDLRVGHILDCLAKDGDTTAVVAAASRALAERGVDVMVSNQSHSAWIHGMKSNGFLTGPSNFIFAVSKTLGERLGPFADAVARSHITRGDGDNLLQYC